jgi:DNA polymerase III delta subunit
MSLQDLRKELLAGTRRAVYVLVGPRPMVDRARTTIEEYVAPQGRRGAQVERVWVADDPNPARALDLVRELSMFGPRRVVELRGLEHAKAELCHDVLGYLPAPVEGSTLLITATTLPRAAPQGKVQRSVGKAGLFLDMRDTHPGGFAIAVARGAGKVMSPELAQRLIAVVGTDLGVVEQEVLKLVDYAGEEELDEAAIDAVCSVLAEPIVWQLSDGLAKRDVDAVLEVAQSQGGTTDGAIPLVGVAGMALRRELEGDPDRDAAAGLRRLADTTRQAREGGDIVLSLHGYLLERLLEPR